MLRSFVAGNAWLFVTLLAFVGRTSEWFVRLRPEYEDGYAAYSMLGLGGEFSALEYRVLLGVLICLSLAFFALAARARVAR